MPAEGDLLLDPGGEARRRHVTREVQQLLHQRVSREQVVTAYSGRCAICRLKHPGLLDVAHIIPDGKSKGDPVVLNGLSLCKLHHATFDQNLVGIMPDGIVQVREDILDESDGPMLEHGLQGVDGYVIHEPRAKELRPDRERLEMRFEEFSKAG